MLAASNPSLCILTSLLGPEAKRLARGPLCYQYFNKFTVKLCKKAKVPPFNLHQLRHLATAILKDKADMSLAKL
jgi:integrase